MATQPVEAKERKRQEKAKNCLRCDKETARWHTTGPMATPETLLDTEALGNGAKGLGGGKRLAILRSCTNTAGSFWPFTRRHRKGIPIVRRRNQKKTEAWKIIFVRLEL